MSLEEKLVVYAKLVHGNVFRAQNNDLFALNKKSINKIYRSFLDLVREDMDIKI